MGQEFRPGLAECLWLKVSRMQSSLSLGEGKDRMHFQGHSLGYSQASEDVLPCADMWPSATRLPHGMVADFPHYEQSKRGSPQDKNKSFYNLILEVTSQ